MLFYVETEQDSEAGQERVRYLRRSGRTCRDTFWTEVDANSATEIVAQVGRFGVLHVTPLHLQHTETLARQEFLWPPESVYAANPPPPTMPSDRTVQRCVQLELFPQKVS